MDDDFLLLNPGPVPLSEPVREAMRAPMVSHRSAAFEADYERAQEGLRYVFERADPGGGRTADGGTPLLVMGTATLAMEMAVANLVDPDDEVVAVVNGKFGRRFRRIAERYANVTEVGFAWGESVAVEEVADAIDDGTAMVTMVHNETSTGLLNPVAAVGELAAEHDARFVVDGVTSIGGDAFHLDAWGVDVAVTDAQKALAAPPGISALYLAEGIEGAVSGANAPFYGDLPKYVDKAEQHQTPYTSAVPLVRAMAVALEEIEEEGMPARIARHRRQARAFREGFDALGLERFPELTGESELSNTVTAISLPDEIEPEAFFDAVAARNVSISGGQGHLGGQIFRVSNMGNLTPADIRRGVRVIGEAFAEAGYEADEAAAVDATDGTLAGTSTRDAASR